MSYKGSPYYDAALDAGYRGEEAEQMAAAIEEEHRMEHERQERREAERGHECPACGGLPDGSPCAACGATEEGP